MRYYVLKSTDRSEVARLSRHGTASYFESTTRRWIPDPLLAVEVISDGDWRQVEVDELPPDIAETTDEPPPRSRKSRGIRRGRHSRK